MKQKNLFIFPLILVMVLNSGFFVFLLSEINSSKVLSPNIINVARAESVSEVVINEIAWMGSETSSGDEWLELKNNTLGEIDITNWTLKAASGSLSIVLNGKIMASDYFLLERTDDDSVPDVKADQIYSGALSNDGAILELRDASSSLIDIINARTAWPAGDNEKKLTMARQTDDGWKNSLVSGGTPKALNDGSNDGQEAGIDNPSSLIDGANATGTASGTQQYNDNSSAQAMGSVLPTIENNFDYSSRVYISELFPNPKGDDSETEFIELFNDENRIVNLKGWKIKIFNKVFEIENLQILPKNFLVLYKKDSKLDLKNSSSTVELLLPLQVTPQQTVAYVDAAEDQSYAINDLNEWRWTTEATPNRKNVFKSLNHTPITDFTTEGDLKVDSKILFDSSDTEDEDDDALNFFWDFGDGSSSSIPVIEHSFKKADNYKIKLTVSDGRASSSKEKYLKIKSVPITSPDTSSPGKRSDNSLSLSDEDMQIIINEILPNPVGEDSEEEWIELYNKGTKSVNLLNWQLDDEAGGSKVFLFNEDNWLNSKNYLLINRVESNLALNNSEDQVRLFNKNGQQIDSVNYKNAVENYAFARDKNNQWHWTSNLTPGKKNIFSINTVKTTSAKKNIRTEAVKTDKRIKIQGITMVEPGIMGTQYFYLAAPKGMQIYNYRKQFPKIKIGDLLEVSGELSDYNGETRLKTNSLEDIKILGKKNLPGALELTAETINDENLAQLIEINGELIKKSGSSFYVDDGVGEILVYIKNATNIDKKEFEEGDELSVAGILNKTTVGFRLLPRNSGDIKKNNPKGEVLGEKAKNDLIIEPRDKKKELLKYLFIIAVGVIIVLFGLVIKNKKNN